MSFQNASQNRQLFVSNYGNQERSYGVLPYVVTTSNANNKINIDPNTFLVDGGKLRQVKLTYWPINCDVEGECGQSLCDTGEVIEPKQIMFNITRCTSTKKFALRKVDVRKTDNGEWDFTESAKQIIASAMPGARKMLAIDWLTYLYELAGVHIDGSQYGKRIITTDQNTGIVNPIGRLDIEREYQDGGFTEPYILGGEEVWKWIKMVQMGGLNQYGQRIEMGDTRNAWYDDNLSATILNDITNGGWILTIAPEVFKYVYYLKNAGIFRTDLMSVDDIGLLYGKTYADYIEGTMIDAVTGIPWDLYVNFDKCTATWSFHFEHNWDFFVMPDVACNVQGVNGIMAYRTCPAVLPTCPTGSPVTSPAAATSFSWTPGDIFPLYISNSNIGGVANEPLANVTDLAGLAALMNDNYVADIFSVSGSNIVYSGYGDAISGAFNASTVSPVTAGLTFTFA